MKNFRIWVILVLLAIATPIAIRFRAWSLGVPAIRQVATAGAAQNSAQSPVASTPAAPAVTQHEAVAHAQPSVSEMPNASFALPGASSSLPLLSVIGFGIFIGGLISALRTRPAHK